MSTENPPSEPQGSDLSMASHKGAKTIGIGVAVAIAVVLLAAGLGGGYFLGTSLNKSSSTSTTQITETGSSLLYPLMELWGPNYTAFNPNVVLAPASTGSGTGQTEAELGLVNIGASDAYLANASQTGLINVPVAISAQLIYYNLPAPVNQYHLNLNGTLLAMIFADQIGSWNNPLILAAQNSTVAAALNGMASSAQHISPVVRSDSSGDTFLFTSLCYESWAGWTYGYGTTPLTSLPDATAAHGNTGVISALQSTPSSIGYVGISYEADATGLQYAAVGDNTTNVNGAYSVASTHYILPNPTTISADANLGLQRLDFPVYGLAVSLILGGSYLGAVNLTHGGGGTTAPAGVYAYPLVNLEYTLIKTAPTGKVVTSTALAATVSFLQWAITWGNYQTGRVASSYINAVNFVPLTNTVQGYDLQELASVST
jgi:phosphate transport system substrate-binding protein